MILDLGNTASITSPHCVTTPLGQMISVVLHLLTLEANSEAIVFPAPVPEKFP